MNDWAKLGLTWATVGLWLAGYVLWCARQERITVGLRRGLTIVALCVVAWPLALWQAWRDFP